MNKQRKKVNKLLPFIPDAEFYFSKGVKAFQKQKFDQSIKWLTKAIDLDSTNPLYNCQLSVVYTEIGKYHRANQLLNSVLQHDDYVECYYLLANNYAHLGLLNDSMKYAQTYLEKEPDGEFGEEAKMLMELIEFELEDEEMDDWLLEEEDDLLKYQETVFYMLENEEWKKAIPLIHEMLLLFPDHLSVRHDYAQALFYTGNEKKAIELEQKYLKEMDHSLHSMMNLALFYYETEEYDAYDTIMSELIHVYPLHGDQQIKLAVIMAKTGKYETAYQRFSKIRRSMARGHLSFYKWFSITCYHLGKKEIAFELWEDGCMKHRALRDHVAPWQESLSR